VLRNPAGASILFFSEASRLALLPTWPPTQSVPGLKWPGPPSSVEISNEWSFPLLPLYGFKACARITLHFLSYFFFFGTAVHADYGLLVSRGFLITHNDAQQSVGLLWTSDQLVVTTHKTDKHPCPRGIRTHDRSRRAAVDLCLRSRGNWDQLISCM
jgi:hypothetical protein